ncbi:MAG: Uncharacterised protein [Synechococcus sp. MIT S9220]|nr:MAG: Uncharacterised protein [Synechococcus sp. MIT S9220]
MAERFDVLVQGISKADALHLLFAKTDSVERPSDRYFAATRLGLCYCDETLEALIRATHELEVDELFDRITRRKAVEALGRRKDVRAIPALVDVLRCSDTEAVINSLSALMRIGWSPGEADESHLLNLLDGEVTQARAVIQLFTRLRIKSVRSKESIGGLCDHESLLISGASRACMASLYGEHDLMKPLVACLTDLVAGKRRSAVIDIGDSGVEALLPDLIRAPVSMSLRAKSFFQIVDANESTSDPSHQILLKQLLRDDPLLLDIKAEWQCGEDASEIEQNLSHRDEARQYGAAASLMRINRDECLKLIESMQERLWSDYVTHYYLTCIVGLRSIQEKGELIRSALAETTPQYTKSRIAAAWACVELQLFDQMELLDELAGSAPWVPLRWSCQQALANLREQQNVAASA